MNSKKSSSKNKSKKHGKTVVRQDQEATSAEREFPKRAVIEDSDRKFTPSSDSDSDDLPDYDYLLKLPSSGTHFLLASEQQKFQTESENIKLFNIDVSMLNMAMKSIPFNERHNIQDTEWRAEELQQMTEIAAKNETMYRNHLEESTQSKPTKLKQDSSADTGMPVKVSTKSQSTNIEPKLQTGEKESIQKWLDDILDI